MIAPLSKFISRAGLFLALPLAAQLQGATLSGNFTPLASGSNVNLSAHGILDWAHWGLDATNSFNHKNAVVSQISDFIVIGENPVQQNTTNVIGYFWMDGTPTLHASNTTAAVFIAGLTNGFEFSVAADIEPKKLKIYVGALAAQGQIEAILSDASAPNFINASLNSEIGNTNGIYTIDFAADSAGQTLIVRFTAVNIYDVISGSISLQAATLATNLAPQIAITNPTTNATLFATQDVLIQTDVSDSDGSISRVEFFADATLLGEVTNSPYSLTWSNISFGNFVLTANATDNNGIITTSAPVNVFVSTNVPPTVSILSPANEAEFIAPATILISASAFDPNGTISKVEFFESANKVGERTNSPFNFSWTNVTAGIYTLTAKATDNGGATQTSLPVDVFVTTTGGALSANLSGSPSTVDLTAEGISDWAHWGRFTGNSFNHKVGVASQISDVTIINEEPVYQFPDNPAGYSWSDGTPSAAATNTTTGIYVVGLGNGFELTVPATTNLQTLKIYLGAYGAHGKFRAFLSDFTAPFFTDTSVNNLGNGPNGVYTINYASASEDQTLTVRFTVSEMHDVNVGNVTLQAATLNTGNAPPFVSLITPTNNAIYLAPANISLSVNESDPDGTVSKVEFYEGATKIGERTNSPFSLVWSNVSAGNYVLTAKATDNLGATFTSASINAFVTIPGGFLSAGVSTPPGLVDLTAEGKVDWKHWGLVNRLTVNHKASVPSLISSFTQVGGTRAERYFDNPNLYGWSDGTPTPTVASTATGLYINGVANGFQLTVPADTVLHRLKIYVGVFGAQGRFEASLSDFSAPTYIDTSILNNNNASAVYTINYAAASAGKKLTIKYTSLAVFDEADGNVTLQAAAVASPIPTLKIVSAPPSANFGLEFSTELNLNYAVQFTDSLSPTNWQTLSNFFGNGSDTIVTDENPLSSQRFYRVRLSY